MQLNYEKMRNANCVALSTREYYRERIQTLEQISKALNENDVTWAIGCSAGLFLMGIVDDFDDWDIFITEEYIATIKEIMSSLGAIQITTPAEDVPYFNNFIAKYQLNNTKIDIICEFEPVTYGTSYKYHMLKEHITNVYVSRNLSVPIIPAEAQWLLYSMMTGWQYQRKFKAELVKRYLIEYKEKFPETKVKFFKILTDATSTVPDWIKVQINEILK